MVLVDGLVVGGLTFVVDPHLKWPPREVDEEEEEEREDYRVNQDLTEFMLGSLLLIR